MQKFNLIFAVFALLGAVSPNPAEKNNSQSKSEQYCDVIKAQPANEIIPEIHLQIRSGTPASKREFPFMVALGYYVTDYETEVYSIEYQCGGVLLSRKFVLVAAHCLKRTLIHVRVGTVFLTENSPNDELPQNIDIKNKIKHPKYSIERKYDDIALLELVRPVDVTGGFVRPLCLPKIGSKSADDRYITASWGLFNATQQSDRLLKSVVTQLPHDDCRNQFAKAAEYSHGMFSDNIIDSQFCAQNNDFCGGTTGGAFYKIDGVFYIYGVTSFGITRSCTKMAAPEVFSFVEFYLDWIQQNVWPEDNVNDYQ